MANNFTNVKIITLLVASIFLLSVFHPVLAADYSFLLNNKKNTSYSGVAKLVAGPNKPELGKDAVFQIVFSGLRAQSKTSHLIEIYSDSGKQLLQMERDVSSGNPNFSYQVRILKAMFVEGKTYTLRVDGKDIFSFVPTSKATNVESNSKSNVSQPTKTSDMKSKLQQIFSKSANPATSAAGSDYATKLKKIFGK